jgi:hypothetical protein
MANRIGPLFGVEINGERKNLFASLDDAKAYLQAAVVDNEGGNGVIFEQSETEIEARTREKASGEFMKLGVQYYAAARAIQLLPVTGNLYHHALEMFLKAGLSRKYSLAELNRTSATNSATYGGNLRESTRHRSLERLIVQSTT